MEENFQCCLYHCLAYFPFLDEEASRLRLVKSHAAGSGQKEPLCGSLCCYCSALSSVSLGPLPGLPLPGLTGWVQWPRGALRAYLSTTATGCLGKRHPQKCLFVGLVLRGAPQYAFWDPTRPPSQGSAYWLLTTQRWGSNFQV